MGKHQTGRPFRERNIMEQRFDIAAAIIKSKETKQDQHETISLVDLFKLYNLEPIMESCVREGVDCF